MMNCSLWRVVLILGVLLDIAPIEKAIATTSSDSDGGVRLRVHLPREVTVRNSQLTLGDVGVVWGPGALVAKASEISLGRFSVPGQKLVLDRSTILSRLASAGLSAAPVRFTGAEAVMVCRQQRVIEAEDFIEAAEEFLRQYPATRSASKMIPVIRPKDLVLSRLPRDVELACELVRRRTRGRVTVEIRANIDGQEVATREIVFRLSYMRRRLVAIEQIPEGTVLSPENTKIHTVESDQPEPVGWQPPYGQVVTRTVAQDAEIHMDMVGSAESSVVVRRNETVQIRLERPGLMVTATGTALQEAHAGESLKVRNTDSNRVIICRVKTDGTVEPIL